MSELIENIGDAIGSAINQNIKPCPFCNSKADLQASFGGLWVECENPNCQAQGRCSGKKEKAISAWNRRTNQEESQCN